MSSVSQVPPAVSADSLSEAGPGPASPPLDHGTGTGTCTLQVVAVLVLVAILVLRTRLRWLRAILPGRREGGPDDTGAPRPLPVRAVTRLLGVLAPPLLVLASAHELYLRNQQDLDRMVSVLYPFWTAGAVASALGLLLTFGAGRPSGRLALAAYYGTGLGFAALCFLRALPLGAHLLRWLLDTGPGAAAFAVVVVGAIVAGGRRLDPRDLEAYFAVLAVVLLAREAAVLGRGVDLSPPAPPRDVVAEVGRGGDPALPNVYHLILDSFQDELFEGGLPPGGEAELAGFVRFHLTTRAHATSVALPAILTGRWATGPDADGRVAGAFTGEEGLPGGLREAGYRTLAVVPRYLYGRHPSAFDTVVFHDDNVPEPDARALNEAIFLRTWVYQTLPLSLVERLDRVPGVGAGFFDMQGVDRVAALPKPLVHSLSFQRLLDVEPRLPSRGRYTLVHLALPHTPFRLRSDCSPGPGTTGIEEQTECSLRLLVRLVELLRDLGRLEDAIVLVHGDHGLGVVLQGGELVEDESAWDRTLLLTRHPGAAGPLRQARETARIEDIAPTLLALLGMEPWPSGEGRPLGEALPPATP